MPITEISSVWYPVEDLERAKRFYSEILGLILHACDDDSGWAAFHAGTGGTPFFLVRKPEAGTRGGGAVVTFEVTDCQTFLQYLVDWDVNIDPLIQESDSVRIYTIYDPDGNAIELSETKLTK